MSDHAKRETLQSRVGFLFLAAGCAIGLGNVWRFPFVAGQAGGGAFVLIYLLFLALLGFPVLMMELAVGRAGRKDLVGCYSTLAHAGAKHWRRLGTVAFVGNLILMMYYTTVSGWLFYYAWNYCFGEAGAAQTPEAVDTYFMTLTQTPSLSICSMGIGVALAAGICAIGLQKGVERIVKYMMLALLFMLIFLAVQALRMDKAGAAVSFYLWPNWNRMMDFGVGKTLYTALGQAFFTLSLGVGSMAIFGSYIGKERALPSEGVWIIVLDTAVALLAGLLIFPICFSFGVDVSAGPGLIFQSLPNIFNTLPGGRFLGSAFFLFMALAAMTTLVAVFENLIAYLIDERGMRRPIAAFCVGVAVLLLSIPCTLGFNVLSFIQPLGKGTTILDFEDFVVSMNLLPLGALLLWAFCVMRRGWGWQNFLTETNTGRGWKLSNAIRIYIVWVLPLLMLVVFLLGYWEFFQAR